MEKFSSINQSLRAAFGSQEEMACGGPPWLIEVRRERARLELAEFQSAVGRLPYLQRADLARRLDTIARAYTVKASIIEYDQEAQVQVTAARPSVFNTNGQPKVGKTKCCSMCGQPGHRRPKCPGVSPLIHEAARSAKVIREAAPVLSEMARLPAALPVKRGLLTDEHEAEVEEAGSPRARFITPNPGGRGQVRHCSICKQVGHQRRTCPEVPATIHAIAESTYKRPVRKPKVSSEMQALIGALPEKVFLAPPVTPEEARVALDEEE